MSLAHSAIASPPATASPLATTPTITPTSPQQPLMPSRLCTPLWQPASPLLALMSPSPPSLLSTPPHPAYHGSSSRYCCHWRYSLSYQLQLQSFHLPISRQNCHRHLYPYHIELPTSKAGTFLLKCSKYYHYKHYHHCWFCNFS
jgi:hypothetical protein